MGDSTFVNGRAVVHAGSSGKGLAFPDVCLCPPTPPAGPVPTPLPNTVQAKDLAGGARTVLVEGNPAGKKSSYFAQSTGNETSRPTGGGVVTHAVQGKSYFQSFALNVFLEGEPAIRHLDLLTHNHLAQPGNTPPAVWMSAMSLPPSPRGPKNVTKNAREGDAWIELALVDETDEPIPETAFHLSTPKGRIIEGRSLWGGAVKVIRLARGRCQLALPGIDDGRDATAYPNAARFAPDSATSVYQPGRPLAVETGKRHRVFVPGTIPLWVDLPLRRSQIRAPEDRLILRSHDGSFEVARTMADAVDDRDALAVEFRGLRPGLRYTLTHEPNGGHPRPLFADEPFESLLPPQDGDLPELAPERVAGPVPIAPSITDDRADWFESPFDPDEGDTV